MFLFFFFFYKNASVRRCVEDKEIREKKKRDEREHCRKVRETEVGGGGEGMGHNMKEKEKKREKGREGDG